MNLIRNLVGLIITLCMLPVCIQAFEFTSNIPFAYNEINDEICLSQLREQLLIAYDMRIYNNELVFTYKNKGFRLCLVNNKLILQPGTQIYLNDIDNLFFETKNGCIYVCYRRKNKNYERVICKEEGIFIDDFSACDVHDDECNSSEE